MTETNLQRWEHLRTALLEAQRSAWADFMRTLPLEDVVLLADHGATYFVGIRADSIAVKELASRVQQQGEEHAS